MDIQITQILFQIFNFSVIFGALYFLLSKPISEVLEKRAKKVAAGQKAAEKALKEQAKIEEEKAKIIKKSKKDAQKIISDENKKAKEMADKIIAQAKTDAKKEIKALEKEFANEKVEMIKNLKGEFVDAVISSSEALLQKSLNKKDHVKMIEAEFNNFIKNTK